MVQASGQNSFWKPRNQRKSDSKMLILGSDSMSHIRVVISLDPNVLTARRKYWKMCHEELSDGAGLRSKLFLEAEKSKKWCFGGVHGVVVIICVFCAGDGDEAPTYSTGIHWHAYCNVR